ncbi:MAG TPA: GTP cyclohydrolase I, partial [Bacteroidota bacterium]
MKKNKSTKNVEGLIGDLLVGLGENPGREGLKKTPERVARMYEFLTKGYGEDVSQVLNAA